MDNFYCLIRITSEHIISLYYFPINHNVLGNTMPTCFTAKTANAMFELISSYRFFSKQISINHALYLGQELYKAEIALKLGQKYIQN